MIKRYIRIWWKLTMNSFMSGFLTRLNAAVFLIGKILRFVFFLVFLVTLFGGTQHLAGYTGSQIVFFFLSYNLVDTVSQLLYREVYRFRPLIVSGDFDFALIKPMNALFRALLGGADPLDMFMLFPYGAALVYAAGRLGHITPWNIVLYTVLLVNGLLIATGFHILVLALGIIATEVDHAIMIFRDVVSMGRIPTDVYREPLRSVLTVIVPVGVMMTFPVKAMLGLLSPSGIALAVAVGVVFFLLCLRIWRYALSQYSSASS